MSAKRKNLSVIKPIFFIGCLVLFCLLYQTLYLFFHECGHALIILLYGGTITEFVVLPFAGGHASANYAEFSTFGKALFEIAGYLSATIIVVIIVSLYNRKVRFKLYHMCYITGLFLFLFTLIHCAILPVISLFTMTPPQDDITKFMKTTGFHPILVALGTLLLISGLLFLCYKKGVWEKLKEIFVNLGNIKRIIAILIIIIFTSMGLIASYGQYFFVVLNSSFTVENALEEKSREIQFTLNETKEYSIEMVTQSRGFVTAARIVRENGELVEQYISEKFQFKSTMVLSEGNYTLILTFFEDYEAVNQFLNSVWQGEIGADSRQYLESVFGNDNGGDYSVEVSLQIR